MDRSKSNKVLIDSESDIVAVRKTVRHVAGEMGFAITDITRIVTAASELARNAYQYAGKGMMYWRTVEANGCPGLELRFEDEGPGIADIAKAMEAGFSGSNGLGLGLPGAKRLMDEMTIGPNAGKGLRVVVTKWLKV